jgi:prephenate dehydrogenase
MFKQLGLIGCGLIGGSFALALKRAGLVERVVGFSSTEKTLELSKTLGVIDEVATSAQQACSGSDLVLVAVPVRSIASCLSSIKDSVEPGALLMDVGSTKSEVEQSARNALGEKIAQFIPAHPIAGKELAGVANSSADLFENRALILTPLPENKLILIERAHKVWTAIGSNVHKMSTHEHDTAFAAVSHLPHLIAFAFMNALIGQSNHEHMLSIAGPGFRDFSRIAGSDPLVWRDIFFSNKDNLKSQLAHFSSALQSLERALDQNDSDALVNMIELSRVARGNWQINSN